MVSQTFTYLIRFSLPGHSFCNVLTGPTGPCKY